MNMNNIITQSHCTVVRQSVCSANYCNNAVCMVIGHTLLCIMIMHIYYVYYMHIITSPKLYTTYIKYTVALYESKIIVFKLANFVSCRGRATYV